MNTLDHRVARWMTNIAEALTRIGGLPLSYGEFYVSDVTISFDGEEVQLRIMPSDDGHNFELVLGELK